MEELRQKKQLLLVEHAESLRKLVRLLEYENRLLKENIPFDEVNPFEETIDNVEEYDPDQGERIVHGKKHKSGVSDTIWTTKDENAPAEYQYLSMLLMM